ncbi:unnamed protein product [Fusarium fujikuroi]|uniref:PNPLA domain-containing protein n=1 Tax=Fusarium fujikuroi TaxID=5127 RepID=A0A9Q9UG98_FUSFU|nr:unnamed protein product [Fusarium fujikuroi]
MTWSSAGEVVEKHPGEREVPEWLVDFYQANKPWLRDLGQEPPNRIFKIISDNNIRYLQARGDGSPISGHEQHSPLVNERKLAHVRIAMALHAFPSINSEIIGEEMVDRLMDTAKTSVLPLLSSLTEADIQDWLLPERLDETNAMILYTLSMLLPDDTILAGTGAVTERLSDALPNWRALSPTDRSTMEFLTEASLSGNSQLNVNRGLIFKTVDAQALYGFQLSQHKQYDKAIMFLRATIADVTSKYGETSMQVGLVTAELANCYNILRKEEKAEECILTTIQTRKDWRLSTRRDGIYLRLALADSFIGQALYSEAVPMLESIIQTHDISATFRMMSVLRLAKSRRRMHESAEKAFEHDSPLWTGSTLLSHVSQVLEMEYVEELACSISEMHSLPQDISEVACELLEAVDSALCKTASLNDSPSWGWYSKAKKEYLGRIEKDTELKKDKGKGKGADEDTEESGKNRECSPVPSPFYSPREEADMYKERPWSEKLALSFGIRLYLSVQLSLVLIEFVDLGGVRTLSSLLILKRIMHRIRELENDHPNGPVYSSSSYPWMGDQSGIPSEPGRPDQIDEFLPCHYFDYIAGMSTGGQVVDTSKAKIISMVMCFDVANGVIMLTSDTYISYSPTAWEVMSATSAGLPYFDTTMIDNTTFALTKGLAHNPSQSALESIRYFDGKSPAVLVSLGAGGGELIPSLPLELGFGLKGYRQPQDVFPVLGGDMGIHHSYRLNVQGDLGQIPFDDWQPRQSGETTIQHIRDITETYLGTAEVEVDINRIAKEAVRIRRARAQTEGWEAFAINVQYTCSLCPRLTPFVTADRTIVREHLEASHKGRSMSNQEVQSLLNASRTYRGRG